MLQVLRRIFPVCQPRIGARKLVTPRRTLAECSHLEPASKQGQFVSDKPALSQLGSMGRNMMSTQPRLYRAAATSHHCYSCYYDQLVLLPPAITMPSHDCYSAVW